ncbi:MAG: hypothetical protein ACQGVC_26265 [Myxococcota bacterium]
MKPLSRVFAALAAAALLAVPAAAAAEEETEPQPAPQRCEGNRSPTAAMWYSILHPGVGEYYLRGWGNWNQNMPQRRFYLGFIPFYGWPGYLQVKSAIDARNCRWSDAL